MIAFGDGTGEQSRARCVYDDGMISGCWVDGSEGERSFGAACSICQFTMVSAGEYTYIANNDI